MRAVVYDRHAQFTVRELADPEPGPGEVLLRVRMAGVCGTDLHLHNGEFGPTYPLTPGHEIVGEVVSVGTEVTSLAIGQRVVVDNTSACGLCAECRRARPAFCLDLVAQGVTAPGGFAEMVAVPAAKCFAVEDLPDEVAVFAEPTACVVHGLDVLDCRPGSDVLLFGAGPTAMLLAQLLKANGAARLTVAAPTKAKLDLIAERGADEIVQVDRRDPGASSGRLRSLAPDGFDVVVDATGATAVLEQSLALTRTGGTVFVYGMTAETDRWSLSPYDLFRRELTIKGSFAQQFSFDRGLQALRAGLIDTSGMVTQTFTLDEYSDALAAVAGHECIKAVVVPNARIAHGGRRRDAPRREDDRP